MHIEFALLALFSIATAVALVARKLQLPYTVALVLAGLVLGSVDAFEAPHLTKDLLYAVFLPGLLFEAAFALEFSKFWSNKVAIGSLAIPGLLVAMVLTDVLLVPSINGLHFVQKFGFFEGMVFAACIAATDPIAVVGLFKSLGAPRRLAVLVEGESLLNDGTAVVVFTIMLGLAMGQAVDVGGAVIEFTRVVGMGIVVGGLLGYAVSLVIQKVDDPMIEITLTTIAAYGSFVAAEQFHFSGVIATVVAGLLCGNYAARTGMSPSTRVAVHTFWEYLAFALNSLVFLLIGFEVRVSALLAAWKPILVAWVAMTVARGLVVLLMSLVLRPTRERLPTKWLPVLTWGGLRGGLSMVLVLGLPSTLANREVVVSMTFGVVILSILIQGMTMAPLLRRLGLAGDSSHLDYERLRGAQRGALAALAELGRLEQAGIAQTNAVGDIKAGFEQQLATIRAELTALQVNKEEVAWAERAALLRRALIAQKDALLEARRAGELSEGAFEHLIADVDARLLHLDEELPPAAAAAGS